ncbi:MAG: hypothetical protein WEE89_11500 [Gemmatimonadota bacterium]
MYTHCIFCKAELGSNEAIEKFPVGRRLAFDAEHGRLWVVCRSCERWNLTPLEERWEAIEDCERFYRDTRTRVSTENIGLARLAEGLDLVRVGRPQLPEFAAWRYGEQLVRRRRQYWFVAGGTGLVIVVLAGIPLIAGVGVGFVGQVPNIINAIRSRRVVARVTTGPGEEQTVTLGQARKVGLFSVNDRWYLEVKHKAGDTSLEGDAALRAASLLLPHINAKGANPEQVQAAVRELQRSSDMDQLFRGSAQRFQPLFDARAAELHTARTGNRTRPVPLYLNKAPVEIRLALEMATHEAQERRALEGELAELETMWREAEEIASISDNLLLPASITDFFKRNQRDDLG